MFVSVPTSCMVLVAHLLSVVGQNLMVGVVRCGEEIRVRFLDPMLPTSGIDGV